MALIARDTPATPFIPAPAGVHPARLVEIVDLGMVQKERFGTMREAHRIRLIFQIGKLMEDGRAFVVSAFFNLTLHEKSRLRAFLEAWFNRPLTDREAAEGIDLETLVGRTALVQLVHRERNGNTYADIGSLMALPPGHTATFPDYVTADGAVKLPGTEPAEPHAATAIRTAPDGTIIPASPDKPRDTTAERAPLMAAVQALGEQLHPGRWAQERKNVLADLELPRALAQLDITQLQTLRAYLEAAVEEAEERRAMAA